MADKVEQLAIDALRDALPYVPSRMHRQMQKAMQGMVRKYGDYPHNQKRLKDNAVAYVKQVAASDTKESADAWAETNVTHGFDSYAQMESTGYTFCRVEIKEIK